MRTPESAAPRRRILITRPRIDAEPLAAALGGHGLDSLIEPLMHAVSIAAARVDLAGVQALVATSANGVRAFAAVDPRRHLPLCAVGAATAAAARAVGFTRIYSAGGDVDSLAAMIIAQRDPADGALLHIAGTISAGDLGGALAASGFVCHRAVLYRMEPATTLSTATRRALAAGTLSGVSLYSPRTATIFADLLAGHGLTPACRGLAAYCLSAAVAKRIAHLAWARRLIAVRPDQPAMIDAILGDAQPVRE